MSWKNGTKPVSKYMPRVPSLALSITTYVFMALVIVASMYFSVVFWVYRREKVIKATSPLFSQLILLGIDLAAASQIPWNVPTQTNLTCYIKPWMLALGYGLMVSGIIAKLYRIYVIFCTSAALRSISGRGAAGRGTWAIHDRYLLAIPGGVCGTLAVLLLLYFYTSGPPVPTESYTSANELELTCKTPSEGVQIAFTIAIIVFCVALAFCAAALAFLTRSVEGAFNETLYLTFVAYSYTAITIILIGTYYTSTDVVGSPTRQLMLRTVGVFLVTVITLLALFLPKVLVMFGERRRARRRHRRTLSGVDGPRFFETTASTAPEEPATNYAALLQHTQQGDALFG